MGPQSLGREAHALNTRVAIRSLKTGSLKTAFMPGNLPRSQA
jgi:hypothetical protein